MWFFHRIPGLRKPLKITTLKNEKIVNIPFSRMVPVNSSLPIIITATLYSLSAA